MTFDMNDAEPQKSGDLIPDGTFAKITMTLRPGGVDGESEIDRGLLKRSGAPGSDVLMLDCEFTVAEGTHARRKFWQTLTTSGGKLDESGVSIGAKITKSTLRAMIDSALGLDPEDMSEATKAKRILRGFADLSGITFVAKIRVEASDNPSFPAKNRLEHVVLPTTPEWRKIMDGETVPARPGTRRPPAATAPAAGAPAWGSQAKAPSAGPAWGQGAAAGEPVEASNPAGGSTPAWLNS